MSSLLKKYLMALTGLMLVVFVFFHMLGNLQVFLPPEAINKYAWFLHHALPAEILWLMRIGLLAAVVVHVVTAVLLKLENKAARPQSYAVDANLRASSASRYMTVSGLVILVYIVFHLLHLTVRSTHPEFDHFRYLLDGESVHDLYASLVYGFSSEFWYISAFYVLATALLCWHLSHGVSSMFQSLGLRNEKWRTRLDGLALLYGWIIFLGFSAVPVGVLISEQSSLQLVHSKAVLEATEGWDRSSDLVVRYERPQP